jgi:hypothetical protein
MERLFRGGRVARRYTLMLESAEGERVPFPREEAREIVAEWRREGRAIQLVSPSCLWCPTSTEGGQ